MAPARRAFLGAVAATVTIAGCTSGPDDGAGGQVDEDETETETATDTPTATDEPMDSPTPTSGMEADATVTVGPGGSLTFEPETLEVDVGATVAFVWDSSGHTVTVESQPDGADWTATGQETKSSGFTHTHTFEVEGQYDYFCVPHEGAGMVGQVLVGDVSMETETTSGSGGGGGGNDGPY